MSVPATQHVHYDAFISYSREDSEVAKALKEALERYKCPNGFAREHRRLKVFRDEADFTGTEYNRSIRRNLQASSKLLVLCSPAARRSRYVGDEIRIFLEAKRADSIVPILVEGIPNNEAAPADRSEMAFPEALTAAFEGGIPLAADFRGFAPSKHRFNRVPFEGAWFKTLADILDKSRDEVEQRERKRNARRTRVTVLAGMCALAIVGGLATWALLESDKARDERAVAEQNERLATSRLLSEAANREFQQRPEVALLLAAQAYRTAPSDEALRALWSTSLPRLRRVLAGHTARINDLAFDSTGRWLASASHDQQAILWHTGNFEGTQRIRVPDVSGAAGGLNPVERVGFDKGGQFWAVDARYDSPSDTPSLYAVPGATSRNSGDLSHVEWSRGRVPLETILARLDRHDPVTAAAESASGILAIGRRDGAIEIWDMALPFGGKRRAAAWYGSRGDVVVLIGIDGSLDVWDSVGLARLGPAGPDAAEIPLRAPMELNSDWDVAAAPATFKARLSPDGTRLAWIASDGAVRVWDRARSSVRKLRAEDPYVQIGAVLFASDGRKLAAAVRAADGEVGQCVWDLASGAAALCDGDLTSDLAWKLLYWREAYEGADGGATYIEGSRSSLWAVSTVFYGQGPELGQLWGFRLAQHAFPYAAALFDGLVALGHCEGGPRYESGEECTAGRITTYTPPRDAEAEPEGPAFDPEDHPAGTDAVTWSERATTVLPNSPPAHQLVFARGGRTLISHSQGSEMHLWDAGTLAHLGTLASAARAVSQVAIEPVDGKRMVEISGGGEVTLRSLDPEMLLEEACRVAGRNLSPEEWKAVLGTKPAYQRTCPGLLP